MGPQRGEARQSQHTASRCHSCTSDRQDCGPTPHRAAHSDRRSKWRSGKKPDQAHIEGNSRVLEQPTEAHFWNDSVWFGGVSQTQTTTYPEV